MDVDIFECDWQWEYKQRGLLNYERRTHYHELLIKTRPIITLDGSKIKVIQKRELLQNKYEDSQGSYDYESISEYSMCKKPKRQTKKSCPTVYMLSENRKIRWGRTGRKGYIPLKEEQSDLSDDSEESESDTEEFETYERWPTPVPHKGGRPYQKPVKPLRDLFGDKGIHSKACKRQGWRRQCEQEPLEEVYKKERKKPSEQKISIIDRKKRKNLIILNRKQKTQTSRINDFDIEQIRTERKLKKEQIEKSEIIPPFIENNLSVDDTIIQKPNTANTTLVISKDNDLAHGDVLEAKEASIECTTTDQESEDSLQIKLLRESTRPDTLHTEFRFDYKEAASKPRRFVINISRIVFHHVTLMNRLRLRVIPKLDLTTYLVFAYCNECDTGVDLFRVHVASTWASSAKKSLANLNRTLTGKITQIQELIQCVISAIDSIDLRHLIARENRRKRKDDHNGYRPSCNFSMLRSVIKWQFTDTSLPRAIEWYSKEDTEDKTHVLFDFNGLGHIFEHDSNSESTKNVRRGPNQPDICGGCLLAATSNGADKFMALDACSHWFCEQCWKSRLLRQIKKADVLQKGVARCVKTGCDNFVDPISLLTLLSVKKIRDTIEIRLRSHIGALSPRIVVCPKENCRKIFSLLGDALSTSDMALPIVCRCSHQFCSKCLNSPHWPLTCEHSAKYTEFIKKRKDDVLFSKLLLDDELPDDLLSGKRCFNCGRFVRQFVFRKTEPNEFGRPVCLQCAREDSRNNNLLHCNILNSNNNGKLTTTECVESKITKWYKIACTHRKMKHPEVVKALYGMAGIVADKLACAVTTGKYVGDTKRAAAEWDDLLLDWAEDNFAELCKSQANASNKGIRSVSSSEKQTLPDSIETSSRATSACSNSSSTNSIARSATILSSDYCNALSQLSLLDDNSGLSLDMKRAACNIVHLKLELHAIAEYVAVLLDYQVAFRGKLIRCLERAEDLCFSLGILLQDPHVHNAPRILPTFMRLRVQAKHAIENIYNEIKSLKVEANLD